MVNETCARDMRSEQVKLLKFEKAALALATAGATLTGVAAAADAKAGAPAVDPQAIDEWRQAFLDLAVKTSEIHSAFEIKAGEVGAKLIGPASDHMTSDHMASGGTPKPPEIAYMEHALSILGLK